MGLILAHIRATLLSFTLFTIFFFFFFFFSSFSMTSIVTFICASGKVNDSRIPSLNPDFFLSLFFSSCPEAGYMMS